MNEKELEIKVRDNELYAKALMKWGDREQILMLAEECCELGAAALHLRRFINDDAKLSALAEEIADVEIMVAQIKYALKNEYVNGESFNNLIARMSEIKKQRLTKLLGSE